MRTEWRWPVALVVSLALIGCGRENKTPTSGPPPSLTAQQSRTLRDRPAFSLSSTAFQNGEAIPSKYTADGEGVSPPLAWTAPPDRTAELALIMFDPDAPSGVFYHWSVYGLSPTVRNLPENLPKTEGVTDPSASQGLNSMKETGYYPPSPPEGKAHHYIFRLYALESASGLAPGATPEEVAQAIGGRLLAQAELMGTFQR